VRRAGAAPPARAARVARAPRGHAGARVARAPHAHAGPSGHAICCSQWNRKRCWRPRPQSSRQHQGVPWRCFQPPASPWSPIGLYVASTQSYADGTGVRWGVGPSTCLPACKRLRAERPACALSHTTRSRREFDWDKKDLSLKATLECGPWAVSAIAVSLDALGGNSSIWTSWLDNTIRC